MLLSVLFDLAKNGEFVSEFASEKIAYFLQKFGAKDAFKLEYKQNFYGPYSGKVKHVLHYLNGSYIMGYSSKDKKPFEELGIVMESEKEVNEFLSKPENNKYKAIAEKTKTFLSGFYSAFGLELLSTIDFIMKEKKITEEKEIINYLENWSNRKKTMFTLVILVNNKTGMMVAKMIIKPPIVGVPSFCFCPSRPRSLTNSPICFFLRKLMIFLPYAKAIISENKTAIAARNEMYLNKFIPGAWIP